MKHFIKKILWFILPVLLPLLVILLSIELILEKYPSTFQYKAQYIKQNSNTISIIFLGSSHTQNAINPEYITSYNAANLAFGSQDYKLDMQLLNHWIGRLPKLKYVVFDLSYHSLEFENPPNYYVNTLYLKYYHINNFTKKTSLFNRSVFLSRPSLYLELLKYRNNIPNINKFGFSTESALWEKELDRFKNLNYDTTFINADLNNIFINRHREENIHAYYKNSFRLLNMIKRCIRNHMQPIILIPPVYQSYYLEMTPSKKERRDNFLRIIKKKYPQIIIINYENNSIFSVTDFINEDHLNPIGAKKFTQIVDSIIIEQKMP
jgi:hypothetical protein